MDYILSSSILSVVHSYLFYFDLRRQRKVSDDVWKTMYDYFRSDNELWTLIHNFWGNVIVSSKILSYRNLIFYFMEFLTKYGGTIPKKLSNNRDLILSYRAMCK